MDDFTSMLKTWWSKPFDASGSATNWFLFLGLIIVIIMGWNLILKFIVEEV